MQKPAFLANLTRAIGLPDLAEVETKGRLSSHHESDTENPTGTVAASGLKHPGVFHFLNKD